MALLVHVKKDGKLLVNGAVLENASGRTMSVLLRNEAIILRGEEILPHAHTVTPATRLYYALQCAYLFPDDRAHYMALAVELADAFGRAVPSSRSVLDDIRTCLGSESFYAALKPGKALIHLEHRTLAGVGGASERQAGEPPRSNDRVRRASTERFNAAYDMARAAGGARP